MATLRERKPGVWEVRVFTGRDASGRPTQISRTVRGTKRDAQRVAATLESRPPSNAAGRTVTDVLAAWRDVNQPVWAESTRRDYESRIARIESDPDRRDARRSSRRRRRRAVARAHAQDRRRGGSDPQSPHGVACRARAGAALGVGRRATRRARRGCASRSVQPRDAMTADDVRAAIAAAHDFDPAAGVALRVAAVAGLRRAELAALPVDRSRTATSSPSTAARRSSAATASRGSTTSPPRPATAAPSRSTPRRSTRSMQLRADREADLALPLLRHDRAGQPRSHRMVVEPSPGAIRDRPQVASSRSAALDRDHRDREWPRRAHRRRPTRPRQPGDDAPGLRPRGRGCRSRARGCAR